METVIVNGDFHGPRLWASRVASLRRSAFDPKFLTRIDLFSFQASSMSSTLERSRPSFTTRSPVSQRSRSPGPPRLRPTKEREELVKYLMLKCLSIRSFLLFSDWTYLICSNFLPISFSPVSLLLSLHVWAQSMTS